MMSSRKDGSGQKAQLHIVDKASAVTIRIKAPPTESRKGQFGFRLLRLAAT